MGLALSSSLTTDLRPLREGWIALYNSNVFLGSISSPNSRLVTLLGVLFRSLNLEFGRSNDFGIGGTGSAILRPLTHGIGGSGGGTLDSSSSDPSLFCIQLLVNLLEFDSTGVLSFTDF